MQLSSSFFSRLSCTDIYSIPRQKSEVNDERFISVLGINGDSSVFLDASRCYLLSNAALQRVSQFDSLLYIDLSYTNICSIGGIADNCLCLKSLVLAGVHLNDFSAFSQMLSLELVNLRSSNIVEDVHLRNLCCLRSLDLGCTQINDISSIFSLTRLEELSLDESPISPRTASSQFGNLRLLKILNIMDTPLWNCRSAILNSFRDEVFMEKTSKRQQFIESVINDNESRCFQLLCEGIDVFDHVGPWANDILVSAWKSRCCRGKVVSPFVLVNHENVSLRPLPIHLAIIFRSMNVMRLLMEAMSSISLITIGKVWFHSVGLEEKTDDIGNTSLQLVESIDNNRKNALKFNQREHGLIAFIRAVFDSNIHRITEGMIDQKILNWKYRCREIAKELIVMFQPRDKFNKNIRNTDLDEISQADVDEGDVDREEGKGDDENSLWDAGSLMGHNRLHQNEDNENELQDDGGSVVSGITFHPEGLEGLLNGEKTFMSMKDNSNGERKEDNQEYPHEECDEDIVYEEDEDGNMIYVENTIKKKKEKKKKQRVINKLLDPPSFLHDWKEHPMVRKIVGRSLDIVDEHGEVIFHYLGRKSFFLESRRHELDNRWNREEKQLLKERKEWENLPEDKKEWLKGVSQFKKTYRSVHPPDYHPHSPIGERKERLLKEIQDREDMKYKIIDKHYEETAENNSINDSL